MTLTTAQVERFCLVKQGKSLFGLSAEMVREVRPDPLVISLPESDPVLAGLVHLRNEFMPVVSLRDLTAQTPEPHNSHLIVLQSQRNDWAILVEAVVGLEALEVSVTDGSRDRASWESVVLGSAVWNDQFVQVLDSSGLYRFVEGILREDWQRRPLTRPCVTAKAR